MTRTNTVDRMDVSSVARKANPPRCRTRACIPSVPPLPSSRTCPMLPDTLPDFAQPPFAGAPDARFAAAAGRRRAARRLLLDLQPAHLRPGRRALAGAHPAADGLRGGEARRARSRPSSRGGSGRATWSPWARRRTAPRASWSTPQGFLGGGHGANEFRFMSTEVSRERPVNYEELAARLGEEKRRGGYLVWVVGPGAGALAGARRLRVVHPERLRAGGARRQRRRGARHRGGDLRHHARHEQHRPADRGRPRPPHARHQPGAGRRLDRARGGDRARSRAASCTRW